MAGMLPPGALAAQAQGNAPAQPRNPRIPFDRNGASFTSVLPFDQRFALVNAAPPVLLRVTTWYADSTQLPRRECTDLDARTRIGAAIGGVVKANAGKLKVTSQDSVIAALAAAAAAVPREVLDETSRRAIEKKFADTLNVTLAKNRDAIAPLDDSLVARLKALPIRKPARAEWTRSTAPTPADTFSLDVQPLSPNRDFTFCMRSVEALPTADSTALVANAAGAMKQVLSKYFATHGATFGEPDAAYDSLQRNLRAAMLPAADSIVVPPGSILAPAPPRPAVVKALAPILNAYGARCQDVSLFTMMAAAMRPPQTESEPQPPAPGTPGAAPAPGAPPPTPAPTAPAPTAPGAAPTPAAPGTSSNPGAPAATSPPTAPGPREPLCGTPAPVTDGYVPLGVAVRTLARDRGLGKLVYAPRLTQSMPHPDSARIAAAAAVALTLSGLDCSAAAATLCNEAGTIARGQTPLDKPRSPTEGNANIVNRTSANELRPWADNLDTTIVRLRQLRDLADYAAGDAPTRDRLGITAAELATTQKNINQAYTSAAQQRSNIRQIMEQIDRFEAAVQGVVSGVVGRDLKQAVVATTSSASYETRARWYVGQDIGVLYAFRGHDIRETSPYVGLSIYLRPVNKRGDIPKFCPWELRCTSFTVGVTTSKLEQANVYSGILGGYPLVVGVGTRLGEFLRLSYNQPLVYTYRYDPDGTAHRRFNNLNSITLSLDADLKDILGALGNSLFGK